MLGDSKQGEILKLQRVCCPSDTLYTSDARHSFKARERERERERDDDDDDESEEEEEEEEDRKMKKKGPFYSSFLILPYS